MVINIGDIVVERSSGHRYKVVGKHYHLLRCVSVDNPCWEGAISRHRVDVLPNQELTPSQLTEQILLANKSNLTRYDAINLIDEIYDSFAKKS